MNSVPRTKIDYIYVMCSNKHDGIYLVFERWMSRLCGSANVVGGCQAAFYLPQGA